MEARPSPLREAIRDVAQSVFDAAGELDGIARTLETDGGLADSVARIRSLLRPLRGLDQAVRDRGLLAPDAHAARGKRVPDQLLLSVTEYLFAGGFTPEEIAELIDDGGRAKGRARVKNVRRRLDRYKNRRFRAVHMNAPDA